MKKFRHWSHNVQSAAAIIVSTLPTWEPTALPMFADYIEDRLGSIDLGPLFDRLRRAGRMTSEADVIRFALWDSAQILLNPN